MMNVLKKSMVNNMSITSQIGFSLYLPNTDLEVQLNAISKFYAMGCRFVFISLNTLDNIDTQVLSTILETCRQFGIVVIADINEESLEVLGQQTLKSLGITHLRIDAGLNANEIAKLAETFGIILNASTLTKNFLMSLQQQGINLSHCIACHNYYPKRYTGLSIEKVIQKNKLFKSFNMKIMAFMSSEITRPPYHDGLPTIENYRYQRPLLTALSYWQDCSVDYVCLADRDLSDNSRMELNYLLNGVIPLRATIDESLKHKTLYNRPDVSDYIVRSSETRGKLSLSMLNYSTQNSATQTRPIGSVVLSNHLYGNYEGEIEICLQELCADKRQTVIGQVHPDDIALLTYIQAPYGFVFI